MSSLKRTQHQNAHKHSLTTVAGKNRDSHHNNIGLGRDPRDGIRWGESFSLVPRRVSEVTWARRTSRRRLFHDRTEPVVELQAGLFLFLGIVTPMYFTLRWYYGLARWMKRDGKKMLCGLLCHPPFYRETHGDWVEVYRGEISDEIRFDSIRIYCSKYICVLRSVSSLVNYVNRDHRTEENEHTVEARCGRSTVVWPWRTEQQLFLRRANPFLANNYCQ